MELKDVNPYEAILKLHLADLVGSAYFKVLRSWPQKNVGQLTLVAAWPRGRNPSKSLKTQRTPNISKKNLKTLKKP